MICGLWLPYRAAWVCIYPRENLDDMFPCQPHSHKYSPSKGKHFHRPLCLCLLFAVLWLQTRRWPSVILPLWPAGRAPSRENRESRAPEDICNPWVPVIWWKKSALKPNVSTPHSTNVSTPHSTSQNELGKKKAPACFDFFLHSLSFHWNEYLNLVHSSKCTKW